MQHGEQPFPRPGREGAQGKRHRRAERQRQRRQHRQDHVLGHVHAEQHRVVGAERRLGGDHGASQPQADEGERPAAGPLVTPRAQLVHAVQIEAAEDDDHAE